MANADMGSAIAVSSGHFWEMMGYQFGDRNQQWKKMPKKSQHERRDDTIRRDNNESVFSDLSARPERHYLAAWLDSANVLCG